MPRTESRPSLHFDRAGEAGPAVLLVMGLGMRGKVWKPQVDDLARDHRVLTFDNRGIGESEPLVRRTPMADFARDTLRVADSVGFDRFHLVGVSFGGMISQEVSLLAPERVRSLTLIATHAGGPTGIAPTPRGLFAFARSFVGSPDARVRALQELLYPPDFLAAVEPGVLAARMRLQLGERAAPRSVLVQLLAVARHDTRERLGGIRAPTLVIQPGRDLLVRPSHSTLLAARIPRARLLRMPDAGHGVTFQGAREVSEAIRGHVAEAERGGS